MFLSHRGPRLVQGVIASFCREHAEIRALLERLATESTQSGSLALLPEFCATLRLHCTLEASIFIPAIAELEHDEELLRATGAKFAAVTALLNELSACVRFDQHFAALLAQLREQVLTHIETAEAEGGVVERANQLSLDWVQLAQCVHARREELTQRLPRVRADWPAKQERQNAR